MRRKALVAILLATLMVFAGCGGNSGGEDTTTGTSMTTTGTSMTTTSSPADSDTTTESNGDGETTAANTTTTSESGDLPPGLTMDGVQDPGELAQAHREAVRNTSYTLYYNRSVMHATNGTAITDQAYKIQFGGDKVKFNATLQDTESTTAYYMTDEEAYQVDKLDDPNNTTYSRLDGVPNENILVRPTLANTIQFTLTSANETSVEKIDSYGDASGAPFYRITAEGLPSEATSRTFAPSGATNVTGTVNMIVDSEGRVHELSVISSGTRENGQPFQQSFVVRFANYGSTTVERPQWLGTARENTSGNSS